MNNYLLYKRLAITAGLFLLQKITHRVIIYKYKKGIKQKRREKK